MDERVFDAALGRLGYRYAHRYSTYSTCLCADVYFTPLGTSDRLADFACADVYLTLLGTSDRLADFTGTDVYLTLLGTSNRLAGVKHIYFIPRRERPQVRRPRRRRRRRVAQPSPASHPSAMMRRVRGVRASCRCVRGGGDDAARKVEASRVGGGGTQCCLLHPTLPGTTVVGLDTDSSHP